MIDDHNDPRWFAIASHLEELRSENRSQMFPEDKCWFVVRICPCHNRMVVTVPLESRDRARRALVALTTRVGSTNA